MKKHELEFDNAILNTAVLTMQVELSLINAHMRGELNLNDFDGWLAGEIKDEELSETTLELYKTIVEVRANLKQCLEIAEAAIK